MSRPQRFAKQDKSVLHDLIEMKGENRKFSPFISFKSCKTDLSCCRRIRDGP